MELKEYKQKLSDLTSQYEQDKTLLAKAYAFSNNELKVGDTVTDNVGTITIEKIQFTTGSIWNSTFPECVYYGAELKKDLTPRKDGSKRKIYQSNIKTN